MADVTGNIDVNDISMYYEIVGQGPPLVLIHGWSFDHTCWSAQIAEFSKRYRVIAFDWRGMGKTTGGLSPYPFDQTIDDMHKLLVALKIERPILCGHSMGGSMALSYTLQHPDNVSQAIIASSNFPSTDGAVRGLRLQALQLKAGIGNLTLCRALRTMEILWAVSERAFYTSSWRKEHPAELAATKARFMTNDPRSLNHAFSMWAYRPILRGRLGEIRCPTLVVHGSADGQVPRSQMQAVAEEIPGAMFENMEGVGHMVMQQEPEVFTAKVMAFLAKNGPAIAS